MELERWAELSAAISAVAAEFERHERDVHSTALVVRVHAWAALHDRPISWACRAKNWPARARPGALPDQSTMSRRVRRPDFEAFQRRVGVRMNGGAAPPLVKRVDGKPLELPSHTTDRDATWSRGVGRTGVGYKLHAVWSGKPMPDAFAVTTLDVCEKRMAARMVGRVGGGGYLLGDAHYDASWLFDYCHHHGHQLVCPRAKPGTGRAPLRLAAPPPGRRHARGAGGGEPVRAGAVRPPDRHRARLLRPGLPRRRAGLPAAVGPEDLAGPRLGHRQAAGQRRTHPTQPEEGQLMHNPLRERAGVRVFI